MNTKSQLPAELAKLQPRIVVLGVGGAGGNAVNNMIQSNLEGVECVVANTDAQALSQSMAQRKVQLGLSLTQGLGAGARPEIGRAAAEEGLDEIIEHLQGCHMVFLTAGMGGGTGTGASPVLARAAREQGILTVGVVTKPFHFEGVQRMRIAEAGIEELEQVVDTLIVIPNQNLFRVANEHTTFADAFKMADDVLYSGVRGVTDLMVMPGLINLDFADIRSVMGEMGKAMMGAGEAEGDSRAVAAAEAAISNPLLDDVSMKGARGVLINITGGSDMTLYEVDEAANRIRDEVDPNANIIFGSTFDDSLQGQIRVSVFATGINSEAAAEPQPITVHVLNQDDRLARSSAAAPVAPPGGARKEQSDMRRRASASPTVGEAASSPASAPPIREMKDGLRDEQVAPHEKQRETHREEERREPYFGAIPGGDEDTAGAGPRSESEGAACGPEKPDSSVSGDGETGLAQGNVEPLQGLGKGFGAEHPQGFDGAEAKAAPAVAERHAPADPAPQVITREPPRPSEEDLLEIPAFLRRQAN